MGMGIDPLESQDGSKVVPLPLIEDPRHPVRSMKDRPAPVNFAPVPPGFQERRAKMGTRDRRWAVFRAPLPPKDYDPSYHNAAPNDQQAGNYPRGDETLVLRNLHPTIPLLTAQLPGLRARAGVLRNTEAGLAAEEIAMHLDTVVAVPDKDRLVLIWRGVTRQYMDFLPDEMLVYQLEVEKLDEPPTVPSLPERMLADYQDAAAAEAKAEQAVTDQALADMRKLLEKANLPADVMQVIQTETDPQILYEVLDKHLMTILSPLMEKYPDIAAQFPIT